MDGSEHGTGGSAIAAALYKMKVDPRERRMLGDRRPQRCAVDRTVDAGFLEFHKPSTRLF